MTAPSQDTAGRTIDVLAAELIANGTGIGMVPPFYAETASTKGDQDWPLWIVRNTHCNSLGCFMSRSEAESLAAAMNRAQRASNPTGAA